LIFYNVLYLCTLDDENGSNSIYEFINTFRDSPYDFFPGFRSRNAYEALVNLKIIKQEISSGKYIY